MKVILNIHFRRKNIKLTGISNFVGRKNISSKKSLGSITNLAVILLASYKDLLYLVNTLAEFFTFKVSISEENIELKGSMLVRKNIQALRKS